MIFKFLIDHLVLNEKWTSLGKYMIPKKTIISDDIKPHFGGYCKYKPFGCSISIRPKYRNDKGILLHEQSHARQYGRLFWLHSLLTLVSCRYRLLTEIEAYRSQVEVYGYADKSQYEWIVEAVSTKYNIRLPKNEIRAYIDYGFKDLIRGNK